MKTIQEQTEVMKAYANGETIEQLYKTESSLLSEKYKEVKLPKWDWNNYDYRIKEQKKTITIEKWLMKAGDRKSFFIVAGDKSYIENYNSQEKVKLLETYKIEL